MCTFDRIRETAWYVSALQGVFAKERVESEYRRKSRHVVTRRKFAGSQSECHKKKYETRLPDGNAEGQSQLKAAP